MCRRRVRKGQMVDVRLPIGKSRTQGIYASMAPARMHVSIHLMQVPGRRRALPPLPLQPLSPRSQMGAPPTHTHTLAPLISFLELTGKCLGWAHWPSISQQLSTLTLRTRRASQLVFDTPFFSSLCSPILHTFSVPVPFAYFVAS